MHEIVKLDAEENLAVLAEFAAKFPRHGREIGALVQGLAEKLAEFRIDRLGIVVAEKAKARIDFLLEQFAIHAGKTCQHFDQQR